MIDVLKDYFIKKILHKKSIIYHNGEKLFFHTSNSLMNYRVKTFSTKEPETLEWIDTFNSKSIFWDIGANVGLYSIYASKKRNTQTIAFEPSYFNLEFLSRNVNLNSLTKKITIVPIPLNDKNSMSFFQLKNTQWSGALSSFDKGIDEYGKQFKMNFEYSTIGLRPDFFLKVFNLGCPDYIKIDVDGIEQFILLGLNDVMKGVKEILIETNYFNDQSNQVKEIMEKYNFELKKICLKGFENSQFRNEIWKNKISQ